MTGKKYKSVSFTALLCVLTYVGSTPAFADGEQAGVAAAVRGEVQIVSLVDQVGHQIQSGEPIFLGDEIKSGPQSGLQILLMDETVFTIGPESALSIDKFIYDPSTGVGSVSAEVVKGTFRFITGKVAQENPSDMVVKLPNGVIGVRGTIVAGRVTRNESMVVLLGPGQDNNASARIGRIVIEGGGNQVEITRPGWGTTISGTNAPTSPAQIPANKVAALTGSFKAQKTKKQDDEDQDRNGKDQKDGNPETAKKDNSKLTNMGNPNHQAGQDKAGAIKFADATENFAEVTEEADDEATEEVQTSSAADTFKLLNNRTFIGQMYLVNTGVFNWTAQGTFTQNTGDPDCPCVGTSTVKLDVDFGTRTFGGGNSGISVESTSALGNISQSASITTFSYDNDSGLAAGDFNNHLSGTDSHFFNGSTGKLLNTNGVIANEAVFDIQYDDGGGLTGSGKAIDSTREAGLSGP